MWGVMANYYIGQPGRPPEYMVNPKLFNNSNNQSKRNSASRSQMCSVPIVLVLSTSTMGRDKVSMSSILSFKEWPPDVMDKINQLNYII